MAVWSAIQGSATLLGPIIGGVFVALLDWRWIFFVNIPIGLISIICALRFIPRFSGNNHKFDVIGIALSTVGLAMLVLTIQQGTAMSTPTLWTLLAGAVVILVLFIRIAEKSERASGSINFVQWSGFQFVYCGPHPFFAGR